MCRPFFAQAAVRTAGPVQSTVIVLQHPDELLLGLSFLWHAGQKGRGHAYTGAGPQLAAGTPLVR